MKTTLSLNLVRVALTLAPAVVLTACGVGPVWCVWGCVASGLMVWRS